MSPGLLNRPYLQDPYRPDRIRGRLAYLLVGVFAATIAFLALQVARGYWDQTREFAEVVLPAEAALLGSALGFYFTARQEVA